MRRRLTNTSIQIERRRSLSHSSMSSMHSDRYAQPHLLNSNIYNNNNNGIYASTTTNNNNIYGTLKKILPDSVKNLQPGFEANIPRILVIPRGHKGFGFILRGSLSKKNYFFVKVRLGDVKIFLNKRVFFCFRRK